MKKMVILIIWFWILLLILSFVVIMVSFKYAEIWKLQIISPDFQSNTFLWSQFTCDWSNLIPKLEINNLPENTKSLAIIIDDPDAPKSTFVHFLAWDIKTNWKTSLILFPDNKDSLELITRGLNSFWNLNWWWPCPPVWHWIHRYFFKIYALSKEKLDLEEWVNKELLLDSMQPYNLSYWEIIGLYKRD